MKVKYITGDLGGPGQDGSPVGAYPKDFRGVSYRLTAGTVPTSSTWAQEQAKLNPSVRLTSEKKGCVYVLKKIK